MFGDADIHGALPISGVGGKFAADIAFRLLLAGVKIQVDYSLFDSVVLPKDERDMSFNGWY